MSHTDHNKWAMFKNYMHNELGITKEDIRKWTDEAIKKVAMDYINNNLKKASMEEMVTAAVNNMMKDQFGGYRGNHLRDEIAKELAKKLIVGIKPIDQQVAEKLQE